MGVFETAKPRPWFAGREATVLFYKVNRRPSPQPTIFSLYEEDAFEHLVRVLPFGAPVETGRRFKRTWFLGDADVNPDDRVLVGQIGWERPERLEAATFDQTKRRWVDAVREGPVGNHAPFVFDGETGQLAVLKHPTFHPETIAHVFTILLNRGEQRTGAAEWEVQPLLDVTSFRSWLERTHAVQRVTFVAKLPNPDVLDEFAPLLRRLEERKAAALREHWDARDPDEGLEEIDEDPDARQMIAAAEHGYGYVTAQGTTEEGSGTRFNQRQTVRRATTQPLPSTWGEMMGMFIDFALSKLRKD